MTTSTTNEMPSVLAFRRTMSPGHVLMYSAPSLDFKQDDLQPVLVREEPLRGLNATAKTLEEKKHEAVLQVVESAELAPGHGFLVLRARVAVTPAFASAHSCNSTEFLKRHIAALERIREAGGVRELAGRYALTLASGDWAWRNAMEAQSVEVRVRTPEGELRFPDLLLDEERPFDLNNEAYAKHVEGLKKLADELERAMLTKSRRARRFEVEAVLDMGLGARVYPSQEWASKNYKEESKLRWPGGEGVTRILAKLSRKDGTKQAIINDRKMGNRLRAIDTWHGEAGVGAIAVEPYGANSHHADAFRKNKNSAFELFKAVSEGRALSAEEGLFYLAICVRGGVFGG